MKEQTFRLGTFGGVSVNGPDGSVLSGFAAQRKAVALLVLLVRAGPRGLARDKIMSYLWPESDTEQARNAMYNLLFRVRRIFGTEAVVGTADLSLGSMYISSDVGDFDAAIAAGNFEQAEALYAGPFLDAFHVRDAPEFEHWASAERGRLLSSYLDVLEQLAGQAAARGDRNASARWWRKRAEAEPLSSRAARACIDALVAAGERESAMSFLSAHVALVREELGIEPDTALRELAERLRTPSASRTSSPPNFDSRDSRLDASTPEATAPDASTLRPPLRSSRRLVLWSGLGSVFVAALVLSLVAVSNWRDRRSKIGSEAPDSARVLVAAFDNRTGDSTLDYVGYIAADWITQGLSQSEIVKVVYGPTAFALSRGAMDEGPAADRVHLLSARSNAGTVIHGSFYLVHDSIVINAEVSDGSSGRLRRAIPPITAPKSDPMRAVRVLRERSVGALMTIFDPRLASLSGLSSTPPLVDAYRAYLDGLELFRQGKPPKLAGEQFLLAAHRDSSFTLAVIWAAMMANNAGDLPLRDSLFRVLDAPRSQLSLIDRSAFEFLKVTSDTQSSLRQKIAAGDLISKLAPGSNWSYMQGALLERAGDTRHALDLLEQVDAEHTWAGAWREYWMRLASAQHILGRYADELRTSERMNQVGTALGNPVLGRVAGIKALIGLGQTDSAMARVRAALPSITEAERANLLMVTARALRSRGQRASSDSLFRVVLDWDRTRLASPDTSGFVVYDYIDHALQAGAVDDAEAGARTILSNPPRTDPRRRVFLGMAHTALGVVAARKGDRSEALGQLDQIRGFFPGDAAKLRAVVAGALRDRALALRYIGEAESMQVSGLWAPTLAYQYSDLSWLENDPRLRVAFTGGEGR